MKIHRFIGDFEFKEKEFEIKDKEIINQIKKVLRLKEGEFLELSNGENITALVEIKKIEKNSILVENKKIQPNEKKAKNKVALFCAVLKKENFELVVQKATECGINKIFPIITERTIKTGLNTERLKKIAKEASEQCGRSDIPEITEPISFDQSLEITKKENLNILFDAIGEYFLAESDLSSKMPWGRDGASTRNFSAEKYPCILEDKPLKANIFIGPEGGWTEKEIKKAKNHNLKISSLGALTFRGETAAIIATYLAVNL